MCGCHPPSAGGADYAPEFIPVEGAYNVRDAGGVPARGGFVREGLLLRADSLENLTARDVGLLESLGLRTIIDLRDGTADAHRDSGAIPIGCRTVSVPLAYEQWDEGEIAQASSPAAYMADRYLEILQAGAPSVLEVLELVAGGAPMPCIINCGFGKDRTGLVIAIILSLVGVPDSYVARDFALSRDGIARMKHAAAGEGPVGLRARLAQPSLFLDAPPEAMLLFLDRIRSEYGSVEAFVRSFDAHGDLSTRLRAVLVASA